MKRPKFSIIIPVYNVENYLSQCMDSVIGQTLYDIEIICVNDGTKDSSKAVLESYQKKDHRIQIFDKENGGLSSARNYGLEKATGEYVVFIDSDDYVEQRLCERLYYEMLCENPDIIVFGGHVFPGYLKPDPWLIRNLSPRTKIYREDSINALIDENGATPFVWRDCFKLHFLKKNQLRFDENVRFAEDLIFQFFSFPLAKKIVFISDKLYFYRWSRPNSLMANASKNVSLKYRQHLDAMEIIAAFWQQRGLLEQYRDKFMKWTLIFMGWDLCHYKGADRKELMQLLCIFWRKYGLENCKTELSRKQKLYFYYIKNSPK